MKQAREAWEENYDIHKRMWDEGIERAKKNAALGWRWFQNKLVDTEGGMHHYYTWKVLNENGKDQGSNLHNVEAVYKSGLFERVESEIEGYFEWKLKGNDTQVISSNDDCTILPQSSNDASDSHTTSQLSKPYIVSFFARFFPWIDNS